MCKITENLMLCTCEDEPPLPTIHHKKSKRWEEKQPKPHKNEYTWMLSKYCGEYDSPVQEMGRAIMPSKMLSIDITAELFAKELNKRYCFDFEYELKDGDYLKVQKNGTYSDYFTFIFRNGIWEVDWYSPFGNEILTTVNSGKVKF